MGDGYNAVNVIRSIQKLAWDLKNRVDQAKSAHKCGHFSVEERCAAALLGRALTRQLNDVLSDLTELSELIQQAICKSHVNQHSECPLKGSTFIELLAAALENWHPKSHGVTELKTTALNEVKNCPLPHAETSVCESGLELDEACLVELELGKCGANAQPRKLKRVIHELRKLEKDLSFHGGILCDAASLSLSTSYETANFAYGSTPLSSWMKICEHSKIKPLLLEAAQNQKLYMVWGSSSGWLVFYGALAYGFGAVGIELLETNIRSAQAIAKQNTVDSVEFIHGDLLGSDLNNVGVLVLTSQCWDPELVVKANAKIVQELPIGAMCIDYTPALVGALGQPLALINIPVSWNEHQKMHIFVKE